MIFGLTGKNGSGKSTVADFFITRGFQFYSLSDILREELQKEKKPLTREMLIEIGNRLREQQGPSVLAEKIFEKIHPDKNYVIDSIRNPFEVKTLRRLSHFKLIRVEAPIELRFERCKLRSRESAELTLDAFKTMEDKELKSNSPTAQQILQTESLADTTITNEHNIETLHAQLIALLKKTAQEIQRPDWDEYFMSIARVVAKRSNCIKRHVAAILVKDKRIISTGYNGTPRGIMNCNEGGCPRCNDFGISGKNLGECLCSHAEENAITQAAYYGISIKDSTLYTTFSPCLMCTKMIINSSIKNLVYDSTYSLNNLEFSLLKEAGVTVQALQFK
jgi:dCMP deaminase